MYEIGKIKKKKKKITTKKKGWEKRIEEYINNIKRTTRIKQKLKKLYRRKILIKNEFDNQ